MKISKFASAFVAVSLTFFGNVNAASFDCTKASTPLEKTICGNSKLSDLDEKLAEAYKIARANSQDPAKLKLEQIEWIKEARNCQSDASCIERSYNKRLSELDPQPVKVTQETQAPSPPTLATAPETVASAAQIAASSAVVELSSPTAGVATQTEAPAPAVSAASANNVDANSNIFSNEAYQRYALIAVGAMFGALALFYILRFLIALAKRGAAKAASAAREGLSIVEAESEKIKARVGDKTKELSDLAVTKTAAFKEDANNMASKMAAEFNKEGGNKDRIFQQAEKSKATILPTIKAIWLWYKTLFDTHPIKTGIITIIVIGVIFGDNKNQVSGSGGDQRAPDGLTKSQWYERCESYVKARNECAVANKVNQCIEIKIGDLAAGMSQTYCKDSTPDFWLMGMK